MQKPTPATATPETYAALKKAYDHFNVELFQGRLPGALMVISHRKMTNGWYIKGRYASDGTNLRADEISINPERIGTGGVISAMATAVHEMCHQYQAHFGKPPRSGYHDREFQEIMQERGLITTHDGSFYGKRVGQKLTHYIDQSGAFLSSYRKLVESGFVMNWYDHWSRANRGDGSFRCLVGPYPPRERRSHPEGDFGDELDLEDANSDYVHPSLIQLPSTFISAVPANGEMGQAPIEVKSHFSAPSSNTVTPIPNHPPTAASRNKTKFVCPGCHDQAWGKPTLVLLCGRCTDHGTRMRVVEEP